MRDRRRARRLERTKQILCAPRLESRLAVVSARAIRVGHHEAPSGIVRRSLDGPGEVFDRLLEVPIDERAEAQPGLDVSRVALEPRREATRRHPLDRGARGLGSASRLYPLELLDGEKRHGDEGQEEKGEGAIDPRVQHEQHPSKGLRDRRVRPSIRQAGGGQKSVRARCRAIARLQPG